MIFRGEGVQQFCLEGRGRETRGTGLKGTISIFQIFRGWHLCMYYLNMYSLMF